MYKKAELPDGRPHGGRATRSSPAVGAASVTSEALLFSSLGAKIVVNDIGGGTDGSGSDKTAAQAVVDEIVATGGKAVADGGSVPTFEGTKAMVDARWRRSATSTSS